MSFRVAFSEVVMAGGAPCFPADIQEQRTESSAVVACLCSTGLERRKEPPGFDRRFCGSMLQVKVESHAHRDDRDVALKILRN